jgi:glycerol kinase
MQADAGISLKQLRVDGGAVANDFLLQFQADALGTEVVRPSLIESTALGAAYLAGLAVGYWDSVASLTESHTPDRCFSPDGDEAKRERLYKGWKRAVDCSRGWYDKELDD